MRWTGLCTVSPCQSEFQLGGAVPKPRTKFSLVSSAIVIAAISVCIGGRANVATAVPRRTDSVTEATAASGVNASRTNSLVQRLSAPDFSARRENCRMSSSNKFSPLRSSPKFILCFIGFTNLALAVIINFTAACLTLIIRRHPQRTLRTGVVRFRALEKGQIGCRLPHLLSPSNSLPINLQLR